MRSPGVVLPDEPGEHPSQSQSYDENNKRNNNLSDRNASVFKYPQFKLP